jgi:hypothetical protein
MCPINGLAIQIFAAHFPPSAFAFHIPLHSKPKPTKCMQINESNGQSHEFLVAYIYLFIWVFPSSNIMIGIFVSSE